MSLRPFILILFAVIFSCGVSYAQEENAEVSQNATRYVDLRIKSLEKYNKRVERQQKLLLKRLAKKEARLAKKLRKNDSTAYQKYASDNLSFDSIARFAANDSPKSPVGGVRPNKTIDTLRQIQAFGSNAQGGSESINKTEELNQLQKDLGKRQSIDALIAQRSARLKNLTKGEGWQSIEKNVFYCNSRMKEFKKIEQEPTAAEDKALEYLEGSGKFNEEVLEKGAGNSTEAQLSDGGLQTKSILQKYLSQKFGDISSSAVAKIKNNLSHFSGIGSQEFSDLPGAVGTNGMPDFKVNKMRGLPFRKRLSVQYSLQPYNRYLLGRKQAYCNASASLAFCHNDHLKYGVEAINKIGLGEGWDKVRLSFQGSGFSIFSGYEWKSFGLFSSYQRLIIVSKNGDGLASENVSLIHTNSSFEESLLIGLTKSYKINSKLKGELQILYDVWWRQKGLLSPILFKMQTCKLGI